MPALNRRKVGKTKLEVTELGLGGAPMGGFRAKISDAEAVFESTSTTTGTDPRIAWPVADSVWLGCVRPRVETIVPLAMKMLAISCASCTRPPPLPRRSRMIPRAFLFSSPEQPRQCGIATRNPAAAACAPIARA